MSEPSAAAAAYAEAVEFLGKTRSTDETGFQIAFGRCDSPIEQAFCLALFQVPGIRSLPGVFDHRILPELAEPRARITIFAQQPIMRYRADFLLIGTSPLSAEPIFAIVECDGEAYHSAREQQRRDAARQQELSRTGFKVIRFTGSELFRNPEMVAARTLGEFKRHGWRPSEVRTWVSNRNLRRALAELRAHVGV